MQGSLFDGAPPKEERLTKGNYLVAPVPIRDAREMIERHHYAGGAAITAVATHGLYALAGRLMGVAWWMPPIKSAALATWPNWEAVLALSRLVILPEAPVNSASFLLGRSIRLIRQDPRWECLVTYADTWREHTGAIYRATNWEYLGLTAPSPVWVKGGKLICPKSGPKTRTADEMRELGASLIGRFPKHKFRMIIKGGNDD